MDATAGRFWCVMVGRAEVTRPVDALDAGETQRRARLICDAVAVEGATTPAGLCGRIERGSLCVEVEITPSDITVMNEDYLVSSILMQDLKVLAEVRGTQVIVVGHCQCKRKTMALLFEFADNAQTDLFIRRCQSHQREATEPKLPLHSSAHSLPEDPKKKPANTHPHKQPATLTLASHFSPRNKPPIPARDTDASCAIASKSPPLLPPRDMDVSFAIASKSPPPLPPRDMDENCAIASKSPPLLPHRDMDASFAIAFKSPPPLPPRDMDENCAIASKSPPPLPPCDSEGPIYGEITPTPSRRDSTPGINFLFGQKSKTLIKESKEETKKGRNTAKKGLFSRWKKESGYTNVVREDDNNIASPASWYESPPYSEDSEISTEDYYESLGLNMVDSERIFSNDTLPYAEEEGAQPSSMEDSINHFLTEEYNYLTSLSDIKAARELSPQLQNLLRGVDALEKLHHDLYSDLYYSRHSYSSMAQAFLTHREELEFYKYYLMNAPLIIEALSDIPEPNLEKHPNLRESLRTSWKRVHFYFMSLENFLSKVPEDERPVMKEAVTMLTELNRRGDTGILIDGVKDCPYNLHIKVPLLLHSSFKIRGPGMQRKDYRVLLFTEVLVVTLPEGKFHKFQSSLRVEQVFAVLPNANPAASFGLEMLDEGRKGRVSYIFTAPSEQTKESWVGEITRLMNNIAEKVKEESERRFGVKT
ncbi:uncharacterized protein LOC122262102 [Penaeus japonicus]|uniref:uncharacterized protein LOC122262102 n=1 Tax=Penaeus japonicus TaxID=27405 RepID=UPI001C7102A3|nr:uncharacterized protein LOC122262102 [Penaeus japonicus]